MTLLNFCVIAATRRDILMIASGWVSLHGGTREKLEGLGRSTAFTMDNPQFQVGDDPDPRAKGIYRIWSNVDVALVSYMKKSVKNDYGYSRKC